MSDKYFFRKVDEDHIDMYISHYIRCSGCKRENARTLLFRMTEDTWYAVHKWEKTRTWKVVVAFVELSVSDRHVCVNKVITNKWWRKTKFIKSIFHEFKTYCWYHFPSKPFYQGLVMSKRFPVLEHG